MEVEKVSTTAHWSYFVRNNAKFYQELSSDAQKQLGDFLVLCKEHLNENPTTYPDRENILCYHTLHRYFIVCKDDVTEAFEMWKRWVLWLETVKPQHFREEDHADLFTRGAFYIHGKDKEGRAIIIAESQKHRPAEDQEGLEKDLRGYIFFLRYLESVSESIGKDQASIILDRTNSSAANRDPKLRQRMTIDLQAYFPDCLGNIFVLHADWIFKIGYFLVKPFIDKRYRDKLKLIGEMSELQEFVDRDQLMIKHGGTSTYEHQFKSGMYKFNPRDFNIADAESTDEELEVINCQNLEFVLQNDIQDKNDEWSDFLGLKTPIRRTGAVVELL
eukprot:CAMPEP_0115033886 /NCGR_PEP_ID=MMETSP0216-20121206/40239_1 /TAXON_ID=223996 /ORGANISM="Protocruzia adherens, Strain Boccale" /LENGTH=330 /DNA_ID=CAMNT_0002412499 /DNA_START=53 /DNA_END=1045 /DNA_ORIENTATION=-